MAHNFIITIDLGGTNLKFALLDLRYKVRQKGILSTRSFLSKAGLISAIIQAVAKIIKDNRLKRNDLLGLGLGVPGPVDNSKGIVHFFPNIPGWREVKLKQILERKLNISVTLDNDANLMALAESRLGAARGKKTALCLTLGTGVGAGIVIGGKIYRGRDNAAAELGHMPVALRGRRCNCGGRGCLEAYVGNRPLLRRAKALFKRNVSLEEVSRMAKSGNRRALYFWSEVSGYLSAALTGAVNLLNPDCIVIGGGVAAAGKVLFDDLRGSVRKRAMYIQARGLKIVKAKLGNDAGLIGAAIMVKETSKIK